MELYRGMKFALLEISMVSFSISRLYIANVRFEETVMSVLLPTFYFEKTNDIIDWRLGITLSPYVRGKEAEGPQVPMKVSLL